LIFLNTSQSTPDSKYPAERQKCRDREGGREGGREGVQGFIKRNETSDSAHTNANTSQYHTSRSLYHLKVLEVLMLKSLPSCDSFAWLVSKHFLSANRNRSIECTEII